jgi:hypothetical protein
VLAGPLAWLVSLEAGYVASYAICEPGSGAAIHVAILTPLIVIALGAIGVFAVSRRHGEATRRGGEAMLAQSAYWFSAAFAVLILATYAPVWGLLPCR